MKKEKRLAGSDENRWDKLKKRTSFLLSLRTAAEDVRSVLGDGLGSLGHGMSRQLSGQQETRCGLRKKK